MAQIRVDIESQDRARQNVQNLRQEIARIGEEIARNNRLAARASEEDRQRLNQKNRELRLTRSVLEANRRASQVALSGIQQERRARERLTQANERSAASENAARRRALQDAITFRRTQRREADRAARAEARAVEQAAERERDARRRALNDAITFRRAQRREAERTARAEVAAAEQLRSVRQDVFRNVAFGAAAVTASLGLLGRSFVTAGIRMEGIRDGLTALEGSSEAAEARLASLRDVIRQPGVEYQAAVQAAVELKAVGLEAEVANRVIQEFGNSLALVGRTDLRDTLLGLRQILSRGRVSQEELNQITERSSLLSQILQERFGTVLSEGIQSQLDAAGQNVIEGFLEPVLQGLERLDRAPVDSALNSIQNLGNATFELRASLGDILLPTVTSVVQQLTAATEAFTAMDEGVQRAIVTVGTIATGLAGATAAVAGLGFAVTAVQRGLAVFQTGGAFAGLTAAGPAIGIVAAALAPLVIGFANYRRRVAEAREESQAFANQIRLTAASLGSTSGIQARIDELQEYIATLRETSEAYEESLGTGAARAFALTATSGQAGERDAFENRNERIRITERLIAILEQYRETGSATAEQIQELDRIISSTLQQAEIQGDAEAITTLNTAVSTLEERLQGYSEANKEAAESARESVAETRNYSLELVNLQDGLRSAVDAFRGVESLGDLGPAADAVRSAQDRVTASALADIDAQIAANQVIVDNERSKANEIERAQERIASLQTRRRRIELDGEYELTRVTQQEADRRVRIEEEASRRQLEYDRRVANARQQLRRERQSELEDATRQIREIQNPEEQERLAGRFGLFLSRGLAPAEALRSAENAIRLIDGIRNSLLNVEPAARVVAGTLRGRLTQGLDYASELWERMGNNVRTTREALLDLGFAMDSVARNIQSVRLGDTIARLEDGQAGRDQRTEEVFGSGAALFRRNEERLRSQSQNFIRNLRLNNPARQLGAGIIESIVDVPSDLISASIDSLIEIPRQVERELERLNRRKLDRIADVNEEEELSVAQKEERILEIERDFARRRIRIEEDANRQKIESFRSVVTNFTTGITRMIAAQLRLRAVQGATNYLIGGANTSDGGLLGRLLGGGAGAAGGAAFLGNPLVGLGIAGGATLLNYLFSSSFHDPINDALARTSGQNQAVRAAGMLGRESAADVLENFDQGFAQGARQVAAQGTGGGAGHPIVVENNITLELDGRELAKEVTREQIVLREQNIIAERS